MITDRSAGHSEFRWDAETRMAGRPYAGPTASPEEKAIVFWIRMD